MLKQLLFFWSLSDSVLSSHHPLSTISFSVLWKNKVAFELMPFFARAQETLWQFHFIDLKLATAGLAGANRARSFFNLAGLLAECVPCTNMLSKRRYNTENV